MTDTFSKACLGVITLSLAILAYVQLSNHLATSSQSRTSPEKHAAMSPSGCIAQLAELRDTYAALEAQTRNIPAMVQEKDASGTVIAEKPNRLYVQLMNQLIEIRQQQTSLSGKCEA
ncbi:hypothetical protein [Kordiimonas lacus]|uniref:Uncharacterized protein n=1 Tax=Kordiimonas lacus TaxID=637679 RepID=A0A1G6TGG4_9PROT|nr:hypothetical protein [Kordiimonas lacus]SDD28178.1 hypothetical protein SAMN04488071_0229 [Kordiimonas lacus]